MPGRKIPLITEQIYHIYNRGIDRRTTFSSRRDYIRAFETLSYYRCSDLPLSLSKLLVQPQDIRNEILDRISIKNIVEILCYCLMPNHFHFLLRQKVDKGISKFVGNFQNSYTRYFNTRHDRDGSLFLDQFKAVRIESEEQLIHVSRYIHLNPYTGYVISSIDQLEKFPWSSYADYLKREEKSIFETEIILSRFKDFRSYRQFVEDQANYQREIKAIEHLLLEK